MKKLLCIVFVVPTLLLADGDQDTSQGSTMPRKSRMTPAEQAAQASDKNSDMTLSSPGQRSADQFNNKAKQPLTITQNINDGRILVLSDGQKWEVYEPDTQYSGGWINGNLKIQKQDDYRRKGDKYYRYKIYNDATNDSVWASPVMEEKEEDNSDSQ